MDQTLVMLPLYKLVPGLTTNKSGTEIAIDELHCRETQTIELKKWDIISQQLVKRWRVIKSNWKIIGIEEYVTVLPEYCRLTIRSVNKEIVETYKIVPKIHLWL